MHAVTEEFIYDWKYLSLLNIKKDTTRDGGITVMYAVDIVYTIDTIYT